MVFAHFNLERFSKQILSSYFFTNAPKNKASFIRAYKAFYSNNDPDATASVHVRSIFSFGKDFFAQSCTDIYEISSDLIHTLANLLNRTQSTDKLVELVQQVPQLSETQRLALHAIATLEEIRASSTRTS